MELPGVVSDQKLLTCSDCPCRKVTTLKSMEILMYFSAILCFFFFLHLTSNVQTVEETSDYSSTTFNTCNEWQSRPEEFVTVFRETEKYNSSVGIQIFH